MMKHEIRIWWSERDNCYLAEAPDLKFALAHGDTYEEAFHQIMESMKFNLELRSKLGREIPEPSQHDKE